VKLPRFAAVGLLAVVVAATAAACGGVKPPEGWASPVDQDSTLYYFPRKDRVTAVAVEGTVASQEWTYPDRTRGQDDVHFEAVYDATLDSDILYFGSWDGRLIALNAADGTLRWSLNTEIRGGIVGGPVVHDGLLVVGTTDARLYVRDSRSGATAPGWPERGVVMPDGVWARPVIVDGNLYVGTMAGTLHAYRLSDGSELWSEPFRIDGAIGDIEALPGNRLFVPGFNKQVYIVDAASGQRVGQPFSTDHWVWSRPYVDDQGVAYFGDFAGKIYALDINTGTVRWQPYDAGARVKAAPVVIGDVLVVGTRDPEVHFIDRNTGQPLNVVPIDNAGTIRASLLEHNGSAIIATTEGRLFTADPVRRAVIPITVSGQQ
jgi:eukaryotic-like serine/threonine-protein kinase